MCGLAGIVAQNPSIVRAALAPMMAAQVHRGPDDDGSYVTPFGDATLGLGFRRLAILDLSPSGHQPMVHPETGDCLVFNGEIYNYQALRSELTARGVRFRSDGDTEVLLHALVHWGTDALNRLAGMYAFAFFDARQQRLLLARDPLGIKPLYVSSVVGTFVFASEVRSVLASGLVSSEIDPAAISSYLAYGSVPFPETVFRHIRCFPAGSFQWRDAAMGDTIAPANRYWQIPRPRAVDTHEDVCGNVRERISESIREHLVSDVPVGVFLSAGIDSTIVASVAAKCTPQLQTFSVAFGDDPEIDESPVAAETAQLIGSRHTAVRLSEADVQQDCFKWLDSLDRPSIDGLNTFIISKAVREQGIVVALSGLGGDELFAGYPSFTVVPRLARVMKAIHWLPPRFRSMLTRAITVGKTFAVAQKAADMAGSSGGLLDLYLHQRRVLSDRYLRILGIGGRSQGLDSNYLRVENTCHLEIDNRDPIWTISAWESQLYLPNTLLVDSDHNGMVHSLEIRVPMLDRRVLDYVYALPGEVRAPTHCPPKQLLRQAFADVLRPQLLARKKTGFRLPIDRWLKGSLRGRGEESLDYLKSQSVFDPKGVDQIWDRFQHRHDQYSRSLSLVVLGHYLRRMNAVISDKFHSSQPVSVPSISAATG